jgi:hypothetical protein
MSEVMQVKKWVEFATLPVRGSKFAAGESRSMQLDSKKPWMRSAQISAAMLPLWIHDPPKDSSNTALL